jgi:hypothetical protein
MCLPLLMLVLPRFFLALLFYSHMVSNYAARDGAQNGMMVHEMARHRTDSGAFQAALGFGDTSPCHEQGERQCARDTGFHGAPPDLTKSIWWRKPMNSTVSPVAA